MVRRERSCEQFGGGIVRPELVAILAALRHDQAVVPCQRPILCLLGYLGSYLCHERLSSGSVELDESGSLLLVHGERGPALQRLHRHCPRLALEGERDRSGEEPVKLLLRWRQVFRGQAGGYGLCRECSLALAGQGFQKRAHARLNLQLCAGLLGHEHRPCVLDGQCRILGLYPHVGSDRK